MTGRGALLGRGVKRGSRVLRDLGRHWRGPRRCAWRHTFAVLVRPGITLCKHTLQEEAEPRSQVAPAGGTVPGLVLEIAEQRLDERCKGARDGVAALPPFHMELDVCNHTRAWGRRGGGGRRRREGGRAIGLRGERGGGTTRGGGARATNGCGNPSTGCEAHCRTFHCFEQARLEQPKPAGFALLGNAHRHEIHAHCGQANGAWQLGCALRKKAD